jgi:hypothetical protein
MDVTEANGFPKPSLLWRKRSAAHPRPQDSGRLSIAAGLLWLALSASDASGAANIRQVTWEDAVRLVAAQLKSEHHDPRTGPHWDNPQIKDDKYLFVDVDFDTPLGMGGGIVFAVDRRTGDVWSGVNCREYGSRSLAAAQAALRRKLGIGPAAYRRLRRPGPYCD